MSLKAGRVGVNPADVDPVSGHISPDATDSYTKSQADDKFLSKSDASSTYETKTDASTALANKQPINLQVPISMLSGTKTKVEEALQGLSVASPVSVTSANENVTIHNKTKVNKIGTLVAGCVRLSFGSTAVAGGSRLASLDVEPGYDMYVEAVSTNVTDNTPAVKHVMPLIITSTGKISLFGTDFIPDINRDYIFNFVFIK